MPCTKRQMTEQIIDKLHEAEIAKRLASSIAGNRLLGCSTTNIFARQPAVGSKVVIGAEGFAREMPIS